jgi:hypothetical protein
MNATLYLPQQPPKAVSTDGMRMPNPEGFASVPEQLPALLGCYRELVDILACGPDYVAYSVFDYEGGPCNEKAMQVLANLTGHSFNLDDEDCTLHGPVIVVQQ